MTDFASSSPDPALLVIEDRLDAIGQKYRGQRIVRGAMLWSCAAVVATLVACAAAHVLGTGAGAMLVLALWLLWLSGSAVLWVLRPLLIRPQPLRVAAMIEQRVDGLHQGLSNSLLLAQRTDVTSSPWLPHIYEEILRTADARPLGQAVKMADLRPLALRVSIVLLAALVVAVLFQARLVHGWRQLLSPAAFVPRSGAVVLRQVQPGDTQVVAGQALDIAVTVDAPSSMPQPALRIIFDDLPGAAVPPSTPPRPNDAEVLPAGATQASDASSGVTPLRYTCHIEHLDRSVRYRVEVGGTQSNWYRANVLHQINLDQLALRINPPPYLNAAAQSLRIKSTDLAKTPISVPEGSLVEVEGYTDMRAGGAMLQAGEAQQPVAMTASLQNRRFAGSLTVVRDTPITFLLTDGAGHILFRVPEQPIVIHCVKDTPPEIQMKWPTQDLAVPPEHELTVSAILKDDHGLTSARIWMASESSGGPQSTPTTSESRPDWKPIHEQTFIGRAGADAPVQISIPLKLDASARKPGSAIRLRLEATDNRDLGSAALPLLAPDYKNANAQAFIGPQTTTSSVFTIRFSDPAQIATEDRQKTDELRQRLRHMLQVQKELQGQVRAANLVAPDLKEVITRVSTGQAQLRVEMKQTADTFPFQPDDRIVQKTLQMLVIEPAKEAVETSMLLSTEPDANQRRKLHAALQDQQRRIISTLESLLALLDRAPEPTTQSTHPGGDLTTRAEAFKKLDEALKEFMKEQQRILDQTANLAKKPVDDFSDADRKTLEDLKMAQEKLDAFMQEKIHDFSKLAEQDMAKAALLKELFEVYSEVTMAKDALKQKATEIAVPAEEMGLELAKELDSNIEKWLANAPDRVKWTQEDPLTKTDVPMAELPKELEDMVGKLLEQEEDLFDEMEDQNANWADSVDKGAGWDAADGPIANMSAKGVTGNQLPNNNEMNGRSGEGRSGKSSGEMVEDTATGKGGRRTPTRLDPTPFQQGQVKSKGSDPTGGATGGGKVSGQGGQGLEGPVPPALRQQMQRLAQKQAQLRNNAERLNLQYLLGRYDNFKLTEATALMRRVESDLNANRYHNALRRRDLLVDSLDTSRLLLGAEVHVKQDTTPTTTSKTRQEVNDAMKGEMPPAWKDALKKYYERLGQE